MRISYKLLFLTTLCALSSCDLFKKENPQPAIIQSNTVQPVDVRNNNSGYDTVLNIVKNVEGVNKLLGNIGIYDFTVENNNNINFVYYTSFQSQQDMLYSHVRKSYSMSSKTYLDLPKGADASGNVGTHNFYKPYSNFFNYCNLSFKSSGFNTLTSASFKGDVSVDIPGSYDIIGEPDMGYLFPVMNSVVFPGNPNYDQRKGYASIGVYSNVDKYLFKVCNPLKLDYQYSTNLSKPKIIANFIDVSIINRQETQDLSKDISYSFDLRSDSLIAYLLGQKINPDFPTYQLTKLEKIASTNVASGLANNNGFYKIRHYSTDGKKIGMFFQDLVTKKCWTYSFDYTTHTFTKGIEAATLEFSATGSDIDIDEFGNVYYSGIAGNGSNTAGVSIYKKDISGSTSIIGSDNFLKYGEIIKLKFLYDKVYLIVTGRITNTSYKQLTILSK